jgi:uncharacterized membrane protein YhhN
MPSVEVPPVIAVTEKTERHSLGWLWGLLAVAAVIGFVLLARFNPEQYGFYPRCTFKVVTGLDCPGCGGLRASHQLLQGNVGEAFRLNPLFISGLPIVAFFLGRLAWERWTGRKFQRRLQLTTTILLCVALVIVFGVARNLPWRAWFG